MYVLMNKAGQLDIPCPYKGDHHRFSLPTITPKRHILASHGHPRMFSSDYIAAHTEYKHVPRTINVYICGFTEPIEIILMLEDS